MKKAASSYPSDVAFTPTVKAIQSRKGSRQGYASMEERGSWETRITPDLAEFIKRQASVFLGTASAEGQPYIQHRGGPASFLKLSTTRHSGLRISRATANTSRSAI
jgi:predicted pyridoxine 5'-phosphate oxidase superfamily flavin-nucleotide-binding protein